MPLNTNHVLIFSAIFPYVESTYQVLSHDRIADNNKYHTEKILKKRNIPYFHFPRYIKRNENDRIFQKLVSFFRMKAIIKEVLEEISPEIIVLAVDNDPISNLFLRLSKKKNIKAIIVQEGSARPDAVIQIKGLHQYVLEVLRLCGIQLSYILHGKSKLFDKYLVAGFSSKKVLIKRGVPENKVEVTGQPKYDPFMKVAADYRSIGKDSNILLFAAGFSIVAGKNNINFLKELLYASKQLGIHLIVKLHPRSSETPEYIKNLLKDVDWSHCEVIKEGDETIDLLKKVYGLITVASTVITEALIMDREGILVDYLAGEQKLPYSGYDAIRHINTMEDVYSVIENSIKNSKPFENKKALLGHNLYKLDGRSAERVAFFIDDLCES